jgi:hypothetical protein
VLEEQEPRGKKPITQISLAEPVGGSGTPFWKELAFFILIGP